MVLLPMSSPFSRGLHFCRMRRTSYTMDEFCLLCLLLILLMRSGDVETNPGPNTAESTISEMEYVELAKDIPPFYYEDVGISLGIPHAQLQLILFENMKNYTNALLDVFMKWNVMQPTHSNKRQLLADKLREIDLGGLSDGLLNGPQIPNIPGIMVDKDALFDELSKEMPAGRYSMFCDKMGVSYHEAISILRRYNEDYDMALRDLLSQWDQRMKGVTREQLEDALDEADVGGLCAIVEKHYGKASTEVASTEVAATGVVAGYGAVHDTRNQSINQSDRSDSVHTNKEEVILSQPGNLSSREMTAHTGPSTSASAGIPPQDASTDGAASSSKASKHVDPGISEMELPEVTLSETNLSKINDTDNNKGNGGLSAPPEILARGESAQRAYAEAAKAGTKKVYRTRLMLVGQERVGKTSLKKILTGQGFDGNEAITDGVETANTCEISIEDAKTGEKMWSILQKRKHGNEDKKDDEYSKALADVMTKKLKMIPLQDQESSEPPRDSTLSRGPNAKEAGDETAKRLTMTPPKDQESLGTLSDSSLGRVLNPDAAEEFVSGNVETPNAKEEDGGVPHHLASLVEKNLKEQEMGTDSTESGRGEAVSLSIWDFAGHDVYYTTHQVFLTWRAIYVIVFDLSRSLDSDVPLESKEKSEGDAKSKLTCLEFINFWLCSIYAHAVPPLSKDSEKSPTIFIVGTHRESVKGDAEEKRKKITSAFDKIHESIREKLFQRHVVTKDYAIENSFEDKDEKIGELRKDIVEEAMKESYMGEEIPIRWLKFEEALAADKKNHLSLDETKVLTQPMGIEPERELLTMLTFYHDLGYVVYYRGIKDQQSLLQDMVILNPQWLIDVFKQVITIPNRAKRDRKVSAAWTTLEKYGILEDRLIEHMWQDKNEPKDFLVKLMDKFDLICDAPVEGLQQDQQDGVDTEVSNETEKGVKKRYYVPSRLKAHCSQIALKSTDFYVDFKGFLPDGLFHRLMTRAVRWINEKDGEPVNLFYRQISLMVDEEHQALLEMLPPPEAIIKVTVFQREVADSDDDDDDDGDIHQPPAPSAVKEVMDFVRSTLGSLKQHWAKRIRYNVCFLCRKCGEKKLFKDCFERKSLKCGLHRRIRTATVKSKFGLSGMESWNESPVKRRRSCMSEEGVGSRNESPAKRRKSSRQPSTTDFDDILVAVAKSVRQVTEIDTLGKKLGFSPEDIQGGYIATNNKTQNVTYCGTLQMLRDWRKGRPDSTARGALKTALEESGQIGLADELFPSS